MMHTRSLITEKVSAHKHDVRHEDSSSSYLWTSSSLCRHSGPRSLRESAVVVQAQSLRCSEYGLLVIDKLEIRESMVIDKVLMLS